MTDMENNDIEEKKSGYAALREKHAQEMATLQAKLDAEIAGRQSDKKSYFSNTLKSKGYSGDFEAFADKYSGLSLDDMVSLYVGQNGNYSQSSDAVASSNANNTSTGSQSVIAGANPTTEVGTKTLDDMTPDELIKYAKTQSWYK